MSKVCFPKWETFMAGDFLLSPPEFIFYFNCGCSIIADILKLVIQIIALALLGSMQSCES